MSNNKIKKINFKKKNVGKKKLSQSRLPRLTCDMRSG